MTLTTGKGGDGNIQYATITTIYESTLQAGLIWVGTDDGNVQVTRDGGQNWTLVNDNIPGNPEYWVSRVEASHHDPGTAYVSYTGMRRDDFGAFVYKTTDFGETWTDISANLPEEPVNVIREHHQNPNLLFVGTDFAVYVSVDGGQSWTKMKNNMPMNPVYDLKIHPRENDLIVATHGRGIYIADISALAEVNSGDPGPERLLLPARVQGPLGFRRIQRSGLRQLRRRERTRWRSPSTTGSRAMPAATSPSRSTRGMWTVATVDGPGAAGLHKVAWGMTKTPRASRPAGSPGT